jgi:NADH dehydrogenase
MSAGPRQIVVLGGGFAGLWSAVGAARKLDEVGIEQLSRVVD